MKKSPKNRSMEGFLLLGAAILTFTIFAAVISGDTVGLGVASFKSTLV